MGLFSYLCSLNLSSVQPLWAFGYLESYFVTLLEIVELYIDELV